MVNVPQHGCTAEIVEVKATQEAPFHFTDAGLPDVFLTGIRYYVCAMCKKIVKAEIPSVMELLDAIGRAVVTQSTPLEGVEVRFLRKRLGMKAKDFAEIVNTTPEQLSRWENEHNELSGAMDRFIRLAYAFIKKDGKLKSLLQKVQNEFQKWSTSIHDSPTGKRIIADYTANKLWVAETELAAA